MGLSRNGTNRVAFPWLFILKTKTKATLNGGLLTLAASSRSQESLTVGVEPQCLLSSSSYKKQDDKPPVAMGLRRSCGEWYCAAAVAASF